MTRKTILIRIAVTLPLALMTLAGLAGRADAQCHTLRWTLNDPTPRAYEEFATSVAISNNYILIGCPREGTIAWPTGKAYVFNVRTGELLWTLSEPNPWSGREFGLSVAISGNRALVGALETAYLFDIGTGVLLRTFQSSAQGGEGFGRWVAISVDRVLIGAPTNDTGADAAGIAYLFDATTGELIHTVNNPTPADADYFGGAVAISGNVALVGAVGDDTGAINAGSAYLFDMTTGGLVQTWNNPTPADEDWFGVSVSIWGSRCLVGAWWDDTGVRDAGSAYLFDTATGALVQTLNNPTPAQDEGFGFSVSISGVRALVAAPIANSGAYGAGSVYLFDVTTGALIQTIDNPAPAYGDTFGASAAISGNNIVVGSWWDDSPLQDAGSAYVYGCPPFNMATGWSDFE